MSFRDGERALRDPGERRAAAAPAHAEISPGTTVGAVDLAVAGLEQSRGYYKEAVGAGGARARRAPRLPRRGRA
jgi:catechol-2,3-dioxygenase